MKRGTLTQEAAEVRDAWLRDAIAAAVRRARGCWARAAAEFGMDRNNLRRLARRVGAL